MKQSADALAAILGALHDLVFVHDARGVFLDYFAEDSSQLLMSPSDFLGRTILETMPQPLGSRIDAARIEVLRTGTPGTVEYDLQRNGTTMSYVATIVRLDESRTLTDVRDVSDERRAQREVAALLAAMPDVLIRLSRTGIILQAIVPQDSPKLWPAEETVGKSVTDALAHDQAQIALDAISAASDTGLLQSIQCSIDFPSGTRTYEVRVVPCGNDEVLAVARDTTAPALVGS
jgi:PAS domain-containing protein